MSETKWTPGPWRRGRDRGSIDAEVHTTVAHIVTTNNDYETSSANARLIAAAPELYEVAEAPTFFRVADDLYFGLKDADGGWSVNLPKEMIAFAERYMAKRDAALARARGETP